MLLAAIDIGSNAVRLLLSNVFEQNGSIIPEKASLVRIPLRLGQDAFTYGKISESKVTDLVKTMKAFKLLIEVFQPVSWKAVATSAMREASNSGDVIKQVLLQTGIEIEIIDGGREAQLISITSKLNQKKKFPYSMFVDVGGGSTEVSVLEADKKIGAASFKIGTVRLLNNKVKEDEWDKMRDWICCFKIKADNLLLVGSGGNINKISKIYGRSTDSMLPAENLEYALKHLELFSVSQRIELMGLRPDRADVIVHAGEIFRFILRLTGANAVFVPKIGLSDGIVTELYKIQKQVI
jgi:exopolyphosphatase / guanosine-5'-triphosphate,3'-diphosphate pyrophosphatase